MASGIGIKITIKTNRNEYIYSWIDCSSLPAAHRFLRLFRIPDAIPGGKKHTYHKKQIG